MSYYNKEQFEYEFALRTAYNLKHIKDYVKKSRAEGKLEEEYCVFEVTQIVNSFLGLLTLPKENYYANLNYKAFFDKRSKADILLKKINMDKESYRYNNTYLKYAGMHSFENKRYKTYLNETMQDEEITVYQLINRLRNAVAHANFSVYPEKPKKGNEIEKLIFEDKCTIEVIWEEKENVYRYLRTIKTSKNKIKNRDKENTKKVKSNIVRVDQIFRITLSIEEIETLIFAICKLLIDTCSHNSEEWPKELGFE